MTTPRDILERRARDLAIRQAQPSPEHRIDVVEFRIADERYAIEVASVVAVLALAGLVPLPSATAPIAGITLWRGKLLTLLDIRAALGLSPSALNDLHSVVVVGGPSASAGILVDSIQGISTMARAHLREPSATDRDPQRTYVRGLSSEAITLLDGNALAQHLGTGGALS